MKKLERIQNKLTPLNTNVFGGKLGKAISRVDEGPSDIESLATQANEELAEEKRKATENQIQATTAKRFRSGARGRRSLFRSTSGGGAGFYNRFNL
jgi:hypothetical protein